MLSLCRREMASMEGQEALGLEGDIGGGLILTRDIVIPKGYDNNVNITSKIVARSVGAGSGGFSRSVLFSMCSSEKYYLWQFNLTEIFYFLFLDFCVSLQKD